MRRSRLRWLSEAARGWLSKFSTLQLCQMRMDRYWPACQVVEKGKTDRQLPLRNVPCAPSRSRLTPASKPVPTSSSPRVQQVAQTYPGIVKTAEEFACFLVGYDRYCPAEPDGEQYGTFPKDFPHGGTQDELVGVSYEPLMAYFIQKWTDEGLFVTRIVSCLGKKPSEHLCFQGALTSE